MGEWVLDAAALTDRGTTRPHNEDACAARVDPDGNALAVVADGVSLAAAGEVASQMAVEVLLRAYAEEPATAAPGQRLYRAVQQANIELYDRAIAVPELRGMSTTLTAAVVAGGELTAVHVGDSRLYLLRNGAAVQLTKDHTVAAEKVRMRLLSREKARLHPERSVLTRSVGRELIVSRDRIVQRLAPGDILLLCSDGLHGVLDDAELPALVGERFAAEACRALLDAANARGTPDNLSAAVVRVTGGAPLAGESPEGLGSRLRRLLGR
ncbi:protein phosphatase [Anaeromyxobacter oryzae]|uniref:Protein phosphatase n=1 Tax=Anaeromyxobacter oryzae TaxID=2918170 RepID=A0ABN6MUF3_9BACT|nr:protein phosphatase [Anaeromyxobacter oryzae]